ncbi:hypothetical protein [uncultured Parabacteroides sp.]|uniref:hypothetical protein n=3 Tax=uncultured Parabacteroides sp. TaxID=512312 RepID=UPI00265A3833|nr:hypothetical protein [uncultured Parabacteroides sp.]
MNTDFFNNFIFSPLEQVWNSLISITAAQGIIFIILLTLNVITSKFSLSKYIYGIIRNILLWRQNFLIRFPYWYSYIKFLSTKRLQKKDFSWEIPGSICLLSSSVGKMENMPTNGITMRIHLADPNSNYDTRSIGINEKKLMSL